MLSLNELIRASAVANDKYKSFDINITDNLYFLCHQNDITYEVYAQ